MVCVNCFTLGAVAELERVLTDLELLRDERARHSQAADEIRERIYALIRTLPPTSDKTAIARSAGVSRPTVYRLIDGEGDRSTP